MIWNLEGRAKLRIKKVIENFRGYPVCTEIFLEQFTALIGRNGAGMSTILEELDYFFENSKPDQGDASVDGEATRYR